MAFKITKQLEVFTTYDANLIYTDKGTGSNKDLAVFQANLPDGFFMLGQHAQQNHSNLISGPIPLVKPLAKGAITSPKDFEWEWDDKGSGGDENVSFWRVVPHDEYVALGGIVSPGYDKPDYLKPKIACVRKDLVVQGAAGPEIWDDAGSGADNNGSIWAIQPITEGLTGTFLVNNGHSAPLEVYCQCLKCDAVIF